MKNQISVRVDALSILVILVLAIGLGVFVSDLSNAVCLARRYSFERSFLSELGQSEWASAFYFTRAVVVLAVCMVPFFLNFVRFGEKWFAIAGVVSAFGLMGIGLTPMNTMLVQHLLCLGIWLLSLLCMLILQSKERIARGDYITPLIATGVAFMIVAYATGGPSGRAAFYQKLTVMGALLWLVIVCWHALRNAFAIACFGMRRRVGDDRRTKAYLDRLETRGTYRP